MRRPAGIFPWISEMELLDWVRSSENVHDHQRRIVIWLSHFRKWHAHEIAEMVGVSKQAVWLWVCQYNSNGPSGLKKIGRGGLRWSFLSVEEETEFLKGLEQKALSGNILTAKQILPELCSFAGRNVSLAYVYKLLKRCRWRKIGPRPRHVNADKKLMESFKKTSGSRNRSCKKSKVWPENKTAVSGRRPFRENQ